MRGTNNLSSDYISLFDKIFNMTSSSVTFTPTSGISTSVNTFVLEKNADNSLFKLYGYIICTRSTATAGTVKLGTFVTGLPTRDSDYTIRGYTFDALINGIHYYLQGWITLKTDGNIDLYVAIPLDASAAVTAQLPPCLMVAKTF